MDRAKLFEEDDVKRFEKFSKLYPKDIGLLYKSYLSLKEKDKHSKEFLNGYLSTINDLIIIKQGHWAD